MVETVPTVRRVRRSHLGPIVILVLAVVAALLYGTQIEAPGRTGPASVPEPPGSIPVGLPVELTATTAVRIPSIGVDARQTMELGLTEDGTLQVPPDAVTVGHYTEESYPGEYSPAVYASHVDYRGVEGPFARLSVMEPGDQILVDHTDGVTVIYVVDSVDEVDKDAFPTDDVYDPTDDQEVRLITCGGPFDSEARSYDDNVVVYGHALEAYRAQPAR